MTAEQAGAIFKAVADEVEREGLPRDFLMAMPTSVVIGFCMLSESAKRRVIEACREAQALDA